MSKLLGRMKRRYQEWRDRVSELEKEVLAKQADNRFVEWSEVVFKQAGVK